MLTIAAMNYQTIFSSFSIFIMFSSLLLLIQNRILYLVYLFAFQSLLLSLSTLLQSMALHDIQLLFSGLLTLGLKVILIPWFLNILIARLKIASDLEPIKHPFFVLFFAFLLIIFCYTIISPIQLFSTLEIKNIMVAALAVMLLSMLLMILRRSAITHVIGFMAMENGLFFAALISTRGIPMVVELGIAFDLLVAVILFGVFFFHIRTSIESMDIDFLNRLREDVDDVV